MRTKKQLKNWTSPFPSRNSVIEQNNLFKNTISIIEKKLIDIQPVSPTAADLNEIFQKIAKHFIKNQNLTGLNNRLLRKVPWIIFSHPMEKQTKIGMNKKFLLEYLKWLNNKQSTKSITLLFYSYLKEYPIEWESLQLLQKGLQKIIANSSNRRIKLLEERTKKFSLLSSIGPQEIADLITNTETSPDIIYQKAGLTGQLGVGKFSQSIYKCFLKRVYKELSTGTNQSNLLQKLYVFSKLPHGGNNALRFKNAAKDLAESLLLPFVNGNANEIHKEEIQNFLIDNFGDPRITTKTWQGIDRIAKEEILSWLVGATLDVFFKILDQTADHIWEYRKAFWESFYKKGYIRKAWAILGKDAIQIAQTFSDDKIHYGILKGATRSQSILMMQIGDLIIAEWSHSGKVRIWKNNESNYLIIPEFHDSINPYQATYFRAKSDFEQAHYSSENGVWQKQVAQYISFNTNIKIHESDFMP